MTDPIPAALARLEKRREWIEEHTDAIRFLAEEVGGLGKVVIHESGTTPEVNIDFEADTLGEVTPVLAALRRCGYVRLYVTDCPETNARLYSYRLGGSKGNLHVRVDVHFSHAEGSACRYVKVGVEEAPVYELQCAGEAVEAES